MDAADDLIKAYRAITAAYNGDQIPDGKAADGVFDAAENVRLALQLLPDGSAESDERRRAYIADLAERDR